MQLTNERKKRVIDLYFNQHKTYAEIAEIERISARDIHAIIQEEEISSKAYELFSEGKTSVQVAIIPKLREPEVTKLYRGYWKLMGWDILNLISKETNG